MKQLKHIVIVITIISAFACTKSEDPLSESFLTKETDSQVLMTTQDAPTQNGRYVVVFKKNVTDPDANVKTLKKRHGFGVGHVYKRALKGFSAVLTPESYKTLKADPTVSSIEPDIKIHTFSQIVPTGISRIMENTIICNNSDVDVAVIDTGVDPNHPDLNVVGGVRFYSIEMGNDIISYSDSNYNDEYFHGTHVAGTIGAINNKIGVVGVAPGCRIWAIRVLDEYGDGYMSDIIRALEWVEERSSTIEIINMSLGGIGTGFALREAIKKCVSKGIVVFAAAGNSGTDIFGVDNIFGTKDDEIPAAFPEVATISALIDTDGKYGGFGETTFYGPDDSFGSFSNYSTYALPTNPVKSPGMGIDLVLPGYDIYSTEAGGGYTTMSGTSQAAPHASGLAALYISQYGRANDSAGVYRIRQYLINNGLPQNHPYGLVAQGDTDGNYENIGWVRSYLPPISPDNPKLSIISVFPQLLISGKNNLIITGTGFKQGTTISFINGSSGAAPSVKKITIVNRSLITAVVQIDNKAQRNLSTWSIKIKNPDGSYVLFNKKIKIIVYK